MDWNSFKPNLRHNWFMEEAKLSKFAWVTEDSISMIYELIASGSNITPIRLENKYDSKISNEISRLVNSGLISAYGALTMSSTAIVSKILIERIDLNSRHGRLSIGILLFQDIAVIPILILLPALSAPAIDINTLFIPLLKKKR